ncbi:MAG: cyclic nucleotide-binding domain-containing protein [Thermoleophilaceae bacterium]|nr:cyclic nucleotide-binding domain-containing protein [Thermoleophilaceae bacterium]
MERSPEPPHPDDLAAVEMFRSLPDDAIAALSERAVLRRLDAGEVVFEEGDLGESLFVVREGMLKVVRPALGQSLVLDRLGPGRAFGEVAVLNETPRLASVISVEPSQVVEIAKADLDEVLEANPLAVRLMLGSLARSLTLAKEELARHNNRLEHEVRRRTADLHESQLEVVRRLGRAAESRDYGTGMHITRMSRIAHLIARAARMDPDECELLLHAAPMHDIGKIGIPDAILLKPGPLDPDEWEEMKRHTTIGAELLAGSHSPVVQLGEVIALTHHERWDGSGYPHGLAGDATPLVGRISAIADVFDALISERPYKDAWDHQSAANEISSQAGRQFDPELVDLFLGLQPALEHLLASAEAECTEQAGSSQVR